MKVGIISSDRGAFEPCKFQMILHERVPIIVWLEAYCFFFRHPSHPVIRLFASFFPSPFPFFLSFLFYLMDAENEKQRGRNANCVFLFSYLPSSPRI